MIYSLLVDDLSGMPSRYEVRRELDKALAVPLGGPVLSDVERLREEWGTSLEAQQAADSPFWD